MKSHKLGSIIHGFEVVQIDDLQEFRSKGIWLKHIQTGAQVYQMANQDPENLFSFCFKTPPEDSTGVAHILEHTVLCGSKKYPVKDPFLQMAKGSLQTFLNAMTFPDKTIYPAASLVEKDYYNLMSVYADAVFFPLLKPEAFRQEGHRQEYGSDGHLKYSGVVYNEMKGNYSSADGVIGDWTIRSLFSDGPYSYDSGGDPSFITDLTYEQFLDFHKKYYHPSNCLIFLYGSFPLEKQLKFFNQNVLKGFSIQSSIAPIELQKPFTSPQTLVKSIPHSDDSADKGSVVLTWLTADVLDFQTTLALDILGEILLGDAGPLQKVLLESGLGEDLSPASGTENEIRQSIFSVGLRSCDAEKAGEFEKVVISCLESLCQGLDKELVESVMVLYEFSNKEIRGGGMGLRYLRKALRGWLHGSTPAQSLSFNSELERIRNRLATGELFFEALISKWLLKNPHRTLITFIPDKSLLENQENLIYEILKEKETVASKEELEQIRKEQKEMENFQSTPETPSQLKTIPKLSRSDIPKKIEIIKSNEILHENVKTFIHEAFTNNVVYVDLAFDLSGLVWEDYDLLFLIHRAVDSLGLPGMTWDLLAQKIQLVSGGIQTRVSIDSPMRGVNPVRTLWVRIKMLESKCDEALNLLGEILTKALWTNQERLEDLVLETRNDFVSALIPRGNLYGATAAVSSYTPALSLTEKFSGLSQLDYLNQVVAQGDFKKLGNDLQSLANRIFTVANLTVNLTVQPEFLSPLKDKVARLISHLPKGSSQNPWEPSLASSPYKRSNLLIVPSTVSFTTWALPGKKLGTHGFEAYQTLGHYLGTGPLWESIRMKGGAYGAHAYPIPIEGLFIFSTYRDPELWASIDAFKEALKGAAQNPLSKDALDQTVIGTVSGDLKPNSPAQDGFIYVQRKLLGITDEDRQAKRNHIRNLTARDLQNAAKELLQIFDTGTMVSLTGQGLAKKDPSKKVELIKEIK